MPHLFGGLAGRSYCQSRRIFRTGTPLRRFGGSPEPLRAAGQAGQVRKRDRNWARCAFEHAFETKTVPGGTLKHEARVQHHETTAVVANS